MKKIITVLCFTFITTMAFSQIRINNPTSNTVTGESVFIDASASIFSNSVNNGKGLAFPRTDLTRFQFINDGNFISFPTRYDGMLLYNSGTGITPSTNSGVGGQSVEPGFYYFSNPTSATVNGGAGKWVRIGSSGLTSSTSNNDGTFTLIFNDGSSFTSSDLTGPQGPTGADGSQGPAGEQGPQGLTGPAGADGNDGAQGPIGPRGQTGAQGPAGLDGNDGVQGPIGPRGQTGPQGPAGLDGDDGAQGPTGPQGPAGIDGEDGAVGPQGEAGLNGTVKKFIDGDVAANAVYTDGNVGIGTTAPQGALDVVSTNSGLILPRVASTSAISSPVNGMLIYDLSSDCTKSYENDAWSDCLSSSGLVAGTVASLDCSSFSPIDGVQNDQYYGFSTVSYTGGNEGIFNGGILFSTGVTGLTAIYTGGTFSASGGTITIVIQGTPNTGGVASFTLNIGGETCTLEVYFYGVVSCSTGRQWLDRNLGAQRVPTTITDHLGYGDLFQYGRSKDGHQVVDWTSSTTGNVSSTTATTVDYQDRSNVGHSDFITFPSSNSGGWVTPNTVPATTSPDFTHQWVSDDGNINNPCVAGFSIPTEAELQAEMDIFPSANATGAFASCLKIPLAGGRSAITGLLDRTGEIGRLWIEQSSSHVLNAGYSSSANLLIASNFIFVGAVKDAASVRCIKDQ